MNFKLPGFTPFTKATDPPNDGDVEMTKKEKRKHRREVLKYNKKTAKPLNEVQKKKIKEMLSKMDPKDPEAKLLRKLLNLKKNR
jgi:polyhydroxyalkanoate synthesis regulator phasin